MREGPDHRKVRSTHNTKNLRADGVDDLLIGGGNDLVGHCSLHDDLGARIHQPHAQHIASQPEEGEMPKAEDAAIAPDQIHRDGYQAEAQRLAQSLHK